MITDATPERKPERRYVFIKTFLLLIPENSVALSFDPIMYTLRPYGFLLRMTDMIYAQMPKIRSANGTPKSVPFPIVRKLFGKSDITYPFVIAIPSPSYSVIVPRVARMADTPTCAIRTPFISPRMREVASAAAIATMITSVTNGPESAGEQYCVMMSAVTMLERFAVVMTDKLIPPVKSVIIIARENRPTSGSWKAID